MSAKNERNLNCTCIYSVLFCLYWVFVLFRLRIFILIFYLPPSENSLAVSSSSSSSSSSKLYLNMPLVSVSVGKTKILIKFEICGKIFLKFPGNIYHGSPSSGSRYMRTDGRT